MNENNKISLTSKAAPASVYPELKGLWEELLRIPDVNPDDNFFNIGGDSALVIEMLLMVSTRFDREFNYNKFFARPTLGTLTTIITEQLKGEHA